MPIAPEDRLYTCDVALFRVADAPTPSTIESSLTYQDVVGIYQDCTLRFTREHVNANLPRDVMDSTIQGFIQNRTKRKQWFLDLGTVLEKTDLPLYLLLLALSPGSGSANTYNYEVARGMIKVHIFRPGGTASDADPVSSYSGFGRITDARFRVSSESVIMQDATITGYGPLDAATSFNLP